MEGARRGRFPDGEAAQKKNMESKEWVKGASESIKTSPDEGNQPIGSPTQIFIPQNTGGMQEGGV